MERREVAVCELYDVEIELIPVLNAKVEEPVPVLTQPVDEVANEVGTLVEVALESFRSMFRDELNVVPEATVSDCIHGLEMF